MGMLFLIALTVAIDGKFVVYAGLVTANRMHLLIPLTWVSRHVSRWLHFGLSHATLPFPR
jgi:hypothetical protein